MKKSQYKEIPQAQAAAAGGPSEPPKQSAHDSQDPGPGGKPINLADPVVVVDLAAALRRLKDVFGLCAVLLLSFASHAAAQEMVRMVVFTPADLSVPADARKKLTECAEATEKFYFQ